MQTPPVDPDVADTAPSDPTLMPYVHEHIVTCLLYFVPRPMSPTVEGFGCRADRNNAACTVAGVRMPSMKEPAGNGRRWRREVEVIDPSILKTERPPVTCARSKSYCGRRNRPTAPPAPPAEAGSFFGTFRKWRDDRLESVKRSKADIGQALISMEL